MLHARCEEGRQLYGFDFGSLPFGPWCALVEVSGEATLIVAASRMLPGMVCRLGTACMKVVFHADNLVSVVVMRHYGHCQHEDAEQK